MVEAVVMDDYTELKSSKEELLEKAVEAGLPWHAHIKPRLYNADGEAIERDVEPDAGPVVPVEPGSGADQVRVDMIQCSVEPCVYGLQLYEYLGEAGPKSKIRRWQR